MMKDDAETSRSCPKKGDRVLVLWKKPGSTTSLVWLPALVMRSMPGSGLFVADGPTFRHTFDVDQPNGWRELDACHENGVWSVRSPAAPGAFGVGPTVEKAEEDLAAALDLLDDYLAEVGRLAPGPRGRKR